MFCPRRAFACSREQKSCRTLKIPANETSSRHQQMIWRLLKTTSSNNNKNKDSGCPCENSRVLKSITARKLGTESATIREEDGNSVTLCASLEAASACEEHFGGDDTCNRRGERRGSEVGRFPSTPSPPRPPVASSTPLQSSVWLQEERRGLQQVRRRMARRVEADETCGRGMWRVGGAHPPNALRNRIASSSCGEEVGSDGAAGHRLTFGLLSPTVTREGVGTFSACTRSYIEYIRTRSFLLTINSRTGRQEKGSVDFSQRMDFSVHRFFL